MDAHALDCFRKAGTIARDAKLLAASLIKPGAKLADVMSAAENYILEQGAGIAFPAQTSRNEIAAHYCPGPNDQTVYVAEDVVKVDIGVEVDGYVADNAMTVYLGEKPIYHDMVQASADGLAAAIAIAGPGVKVNDMSREIENAIEAKNLRITKI